MLIEKHTRQIFTYLHADDGVDEEKHHNEQTDVW